MKLLLFSICLFLLSTVSAQNTYGLLINFSQISTHPSASKTKFGYEILGGLRIRNKKKSRVSYILQLSYSKKNQLNSCITLDIQGLTSEIYSKYGLLFNREDCDYRIDIDDHRIAANIGMGIKLVESSNYEITLDLSNQFTLYNQVSSEFESINNSPLVKGRSSSSFFPFFIQPQLSSRIQFMKNRKVNPLLGLTISYLSDRPSKELSYGLTTGIVF